MFRTKTDPCFFGLKLSPEVILTKKLLALSDFVCLRLWLIKISWVRFCLTLSVAITVFF